MKGIFSLLLCVLTLVVAEGQERPLDRALLWQGKGEFNLGKAVPGVIEVRGDEGFPVLKDGSGAKVFAAAGNLGKGRLVAYAHGSFLTRSATLNQPAAFKSWINALKWAGNTSNPVVGLHPSATGVVDFLKSGKLENSTLNPADLKTSKVAVYCLTSDSKVLTEADLQAVIQFVEAGGGLIVATTPWAFAKRYPDFSKSPGNRILARAGLYFSPNQYCDNKQPIVVTRPLESIPAEQQIWNQPGGRAPQSNHPAVLAVRALTKNKYVHDLEEQKRLVEQMKQVRTLGAEDTAAYLKALQLLNGSMSGIKPSRRNPVIPDKFPIVDAIIEMESRFNQTLPAGMMYHIPAADLFPGKVPGHAPRKTQQVEINCTYKGWAPLRNAGGWNAKEIRSTGLYAAPAEVVTITVPDAMVAKGYDVVIGSYGGGLAKRKAWHRYPRTQRVVTIKSRETRISNGMGGLVGIRIPRDAKAATQRVTISGAVAAPYFELGKTTLADWKQTQRNNPGPMAELASERIIITVPSSDIRDIENPDEVMQLWNEIIDMSAELGVVDRNNYRAERLVFDVQPAAGLLHSGYPVCGHTGVHSALAVNAQKLRQEGFWGFFHEYGHNHQHALWGLPATIETTCNLWSIYVYENLIGIPREKAHRSVSPLVRLQTRKRYFNSGADFKKDWSVWTALDTYLLVQEEFGWAPFKKVFANYNKLPREQWPRTQQQINDRWVVELSVACGKNLAPYWRIWNLPVSQSVDPALKHLPVWQCEAVAQWAKK